MNSLFNKVLFIGPDDTYGGIGSVIEIYKSNIEDFKFIPTYPSGNESIIFFFIKSVIKIGRSFVRDRNIEIVHLHSASSGSFYRKSIIAIMAKLAGKKVVFHIHAGGFQDFYYKSGLFKIYISLILKMSSCVICLSSQWLDFFKNQLGISKSVILGNPIAQSFFKESVSDRNVINLLFMGKLCDNKGIFDFITYLASNDYFLNNQIRLVIAGNGENDRLEKILYDLNLKSRIEYKGWVAGDDKNALINECDLFVLPSYVEGLPVSILEAMASGKAIIATNVGGIPSIVKNNYNGWLFDPGAFSQLDDIFSNIFLNKELLNLYSRNSFMEAQQYRPEVILKKLSNYYSTL